MSVLIKGMEMPDCGYVCLKVFANGEVLMTKEHRGALVITGIRDKVGTAIPVPPHGDLIERDALMQHEVLLPMDGGHLPIVYASYVRNAPTIIPAEESAKKDGEQDGPYDLLYEEGGYNSNGV